MFGALLAGGTAIMGAVQKDEASKRAAKAQMAMTRMNIAAQKEAAKKGIAELNAAMGNTLLELNPDEVNEIMETGALASAGLTNLGYFESADHLLKGLTSSRESLTESRDQSLGALDQGSQRAIDRFNPYAQAGSQASEQLGRLDRGEIDITKTPGFQQREELMNKHLGQRLTSTGKGRSAVGISQYSMPAYERLLSNTYGDMRTGLENQINRGVLASQGQANVDYGSGQLESNIYSGYGRDTANLQDKYSNTMGTNVINQGTQLSNIESNLATNQAGVVDAYNRERARYQDQAGRDKANINIGVGTKIGAGYDQLGKIQANRAMSQGQNQYDLYKDISKILGEELSRKAPKKGSSQSVYY